MSQPAGGAPDQLSDLPDGEYRVEITTDDVTAAGLDNGLATRVRGL